MVMMGRYWIRRLRGVRRGGLLVLRRVRGRGRRGAKGRSGGYLERLEMHLVWTPCYHITIL